MTEPFTRGETPKPPPQASRLAVVVDGAPLDPDAARALWTEFSAHMDEHRGDFAGFAQKKGWFSVTPEFQQGRAVLIVRTTAAPTPAAPRAAPKPKAPAPKAFKPGPHPPRKRAGAKPTPKPKPGKGKR